MKKIFSLAVFLTSAFSALPALAADLGGTVNSGLNYATIVGWGTQDLKTTIMLVINIIMGFLGLLCVIGIVFGGFKMMTAGGNEDQAAGGKQAIVAGVIGLFIVIGAYAIASFVVQSLVNVTT